MTLTSSCIELFLAGVDAAVVERAFRAGVIALSTAPFWVLQSLYSLLKSCFWSSLLKSTNFVRKTVYCWCTVSILKGVRQFWDFVRHFIICVFASICLPVWVAVPAFWVLPHFFSFVSWSGWLCPLDWRAFIFFAAFICIFSVSLEVARVSIFFQTWLPSTNLMVFQSGMLFFLNLFLFKGLHIVS